MPVREVQGFLPGHCTFLSYCLLWYGSWWLQEEETMVLGPHISSKTWINLFSFSFHGYINKDNSLKNAVICGLLLSYLLFWAVNRPPVVVLDLLQLVKLHAYVVNGQLQQVPEPSQVLRGGSWHSARVLGKNERCRKHYLLHFSLCPLGVLIRLKKTDVFRS